MVDEPYSDCGESFIIEITPILSKTLRGDVYGALVKLLGGMLHDAPSETKEGFLTSTIDMLRAITYADKAALAEMGGEHDKTRNGNDI